MGGLLGMLLGAGQLAGGGVAKKGKKREENALDDYNLNPSDDEDESIDRWNASYAKAKPTLTEYNPYTVNNKWADILLNKGRGGQQAQQFTFQQQQQQQRAEQMATLADMEQQAAWERMQAQNKNQMDVTALQGRNTIDATGATHDATLMKEQRVPWQGRQGFTDVTAKPTIATAGQTANIRADNAMTPEYAEAVKRNQIAEQSILPAKVIQDSQIKAGVDDMVLVPGLGVVPKTLFQGPTKSTRTELQGGYPVEVGGKTVMMGQEKVPVTTTTPGRITDLDEKERALREKLSKVESTGPVASTDIDPNFRATTPPQVVAKPPSVASQVISNVNSRPPLQDAADKTVEELADIFSDLLRKMGVKRKKQGTADEVLPPSRPPSAE